MKGGWSSLKILTGKRKGKRHLGKPRRVWENNIRIDLAEICIHTGKWFDTTRVRDYWKVLVNDALNFRIPLAMGLVR